MSDDLLDAIDEFLDDSIVLPPGDWDENLLLPVMHQRNEKRKMKGEGRRGGRGGREGGKKEKGRTEGGGREGGERKQGGLGGGKRGS